MVLGPPNFLHPSLNLLLPLLLKNFILLFPLWQVRVSMGRGIGVRSGFLRESTLRVARRVTGVREIGLGKI